MTASKACLDTWAWWEILEGTALGRRLFERWLKQGNAYASTLVLGELAAKFSSLGQPEAAGPAAALVRTHCRLIDVTGELAFEGGRLRQSLRKEAPHASLVDGIMLATSRSVGAVLVSNDPAFGGLPDVRAE